MFRAPACVHPHPQVWWGLVYLHRPDGLQASQLPSPYPSSTRHLPSADEIHLTGAPSRRTGSRAVCLLPRPPPQVIDKAQVRGKLSGPAAAAALPAPSALCPHGGWPKRPLRGASGVSRQPALTPETQFGSLVFFSIRRHACESLPPWIR